MIGKGLISVDDYIKFGKLVDELSRIAYTIMYIPSKDYIIVSIHKNNIDKIERLNVNTEILAKRGGLVFVRIKWR